MTNEELIRYGKDYLHDLETACCSISDTHKEFVRESIKSLEQQPCDDCVSRKAVIDAIYANGVWENEYNLTSSRIKKAVENLSSVQPKPKTGYWDKTGCSYRCSECMVMPVFKDIRTLKYCPNCGADMRGSKNE